MPTGAIEPDEPQTGWGATSAAAGLKNLGAGLDHLAPIALMHLLLRSFRS